MDEIIVQGDVADEVKAMIIARQKPFSELAPESEGGISEKNIVVEEEKKKGKKGDAEGAEGAEGG